MSNIFINCIDVQQFMDVVSPFTNGNLNKSIERLADFFEKESSRIHNLVESSNEEIKPQAIALYNSMELIRAIKSQGMQIVHSFKPIHSASKLFSSVENARIYYFEPFVNMIKVQNNDGMTVGYPLSSISEVIFI